MLTKEDFVKKYYKLVHERSTLIFVGDNLMMPSGVGNISREKVKWASLQYNIIYLGAGMPGQPTNFSNEVNQYFGLFDLSVVHIPIQHYSDIMMIRNILKKEKNVSGLVFITDPRSYHMVFNIEDEIRKKVPMIYINIWDDLPTPLYNKKYYDSCDYLFAISKQTLNINKILSPQVPARYIPHGIDKDVFFKIDKSFKEYDKFLEFKKMILGEDEYDFVLFFNSRNMWRKEPGTIIHSWRLFLDKLPKEKADRCKLILHTEEIAEPGTDLVACCDAFLGAQYKKSYIFTRSLINRVYSPMEMSSLYNISDAVLSVSSNEGWGLSLTEGLMCGRMIIASVTGGQQDQMRFENERGEWIDFSVDFLSNHYGTYKKCGEWAIPIFPDCVTVKGSPLTPYIYEDRVDARNVADKILEVYNMPKEERDRRGDKGREWVTSEEARMTGIHMGETFVLGLDECISKWKPLKNRMEIVKVTDEENHRNLNHKLIY